jgi:hypothetical protein
LNASIATATNADETKNAARMKVPVKLASLAIEGMRLNADAWRSAQSASRNIDGGLSTLSTGSHRAGSSSAPSVDLGGGQ